MPQSQEKQKKAVMPSLLSKGYATPVGNPIQPIFELQYDTEAKCELVVKVGEQNIDDFIQKSSSSTDIAFLQREAMRTGQYPTDSRAQYGVDQTLFPSNIHELFKTTSDINSHFDALGDIAKKAFGSPEAYRDAVLDGTAESVLASYITQLQKEEAAKLAKAKQEEGK